MFAYCRSPLCSTFSALASTRLDQGFGSKSIVAGGLDIVSVGLWQLTTLTTASGFGKALIGMVQLGFGPGIQLLNKHVPR